MNLILLYLIRSSLSLSIFYIIYEILFKRDAYFVFNRFYLLFAISVSLFLPIINFSITPILSITSNTMAVAPVYSLLEYSLDEVTIFGGTGNAINSTFNNNMSFADIVILIYLLGVVFTLLRFTIRLQRLHQLFKKSRTLNNSGLRFVFTESGMPIFSFLNYIFVDEELLTGNIEIEKIIEHEKIHISQMHSIDLLIAEVVSVIQWFNPFVYLLKRSLKENHEFIADNNVVTQYPDVTAYTSLLIKNSSIVKTNLLTHNFSYSLLKRRLFMIKKTKNPLHFSFKLLWMLIALNLVFYACSGPVQKTSTFQDTKRISDVETSFPADSILMAVITHPDDGNVMFLVSLGKQRNTQMKLYDGNGKLINTFMDGLYGRGVYGSTWEPRAGKPIPAGNYSYTLKSDDNTIHGIFSYNTNNQANNGVYDTSTYTTVEVMPEFPGGMEALMKYLSQNINYPELAKENGIQGRVFVNFIVENDGAIGSVKVLKGIGSGCDEEAVRVLSAMPNWKPGLQKGTPVRVSYNIPIKFTLDNEIADSIYNVVEIMPKFPGGINKLMDYLSNNISYPEAAKKAKVEGRVFVSFVVETDGKISGAKILRGIGYGCDKEALRIIAAMPNWKPGLKAGKPVRVKYNLPIKYSLN